ncbi:hypothetical protein [Endozoicomonas lisbonensis]|uniref:Uncharacterized protein n=1 Tax=Endozoicomonas lisbonensis TaxID=3120522 RepID=A0ABV2SFL4_9GAMM
MDKTPFSQIIAYLNKGMLEAELTDELSELVKAVRDTHRMGELTLKLKVQLHNARDEDTVIITPAVNNKKPRLDMAKAIMYSTADGDLLRNDPNQPELQLKAIESDNRPLKTLAQ